MSTETYDVEFVKPIRIPGARMRIGYSRDRNEITAFVVQLKVHLDTDSAVGEASKWTEVARSDHHSTSAGGHDVTREGVHLDIYRGGEKIDTEHLVPPSEVDSASEAFEDAEEQITEEAEDRVKRFREWHTNNPNLGPMDGSGRPNEPNG